MNDVVPIYVSLQNGRLKYADKNGNDATDFTVYIDNHDGIEWCSFDGRLQILFNKDGRPFPSDPESTLKVGCTYPNVPTTVGTFHYQVTLIDGAAHPYSDDPRVIIDKGGGGHIKAWGILVIALLALGAGLFTWKKFRALKRT